VVTPIRTDPHRGLGYASLHAVYDLLWIVALVVSAFFWCWLVLATKPKSAVTES
jgi:hypothetical protein